nr:beta 13 n galactosyltransferase [Hymenolepis microstoma]
MLDRIRVTALLEQIEASQAVAYEEPNLGALSRVAPIRNYRIPDVDGTNTSCRCVKGPQMYIWPPPNGPKDLICSDSTYDLTLCVKVDPTKPAKLTLIQERLLTLRNMSNRDSGKSDDFKEEFADESKELLRWYQLEGSKINDKENYEMYPLAINLTETIRAINKGSPAPFAPITNPNLKILRAPRTACSPHSTPQTSTSQLKTYDLVVIYKSTVFHFDDRERIRAETKDLPPGVRVVFSVGQPRTDGGGHLYHMNGGFELQLPERSGLVAELWVNRAEEARRRLLEEEVKYGDIIIGDFVDTYVNLTYKILTIHRWASAFCHGRTDVFLFMDDDYIFNVKNMLAYLKGFSRKELRQMLRGPMMTWRHVIRPKVDNRKNKWAITQQEVPWSRLPAYVAGAAMLIGADILDDMIISELYTRFLWVDDAYLGFVVAKLFPRQFEDLKGFYMESSNNGKALVPWFRYPPYIWGTACLVGADVLDELIIAEVYTRFLWVDDAYMGITSLILSMVFLLQVKLEVVSRGIPESKAEIYAPLETGSPSLGPLSAETPRKLIGYVDEGGYAFSHGLCIAIGFISLAAVCSLSQTERLPNGLQTVLFKSNCLIALVGRHKNRRPQSGWRELRIGFDRGNSSAENPMDVEVNRHLLGASVSTAPRKRPRPVSYNEDSSEDDSLSFEGTLKEPVDAEEVPDYYEIVDLSMINKWLKSGRNGAMTATRVPEG